MDIKGNVTISLEDYEMLKDKINELTDFRYRVSKLYTEKMSLTGTKKIEIDEYKVVEFIGEYLNIEEDPTDINVENNKIYVEWELEDIPF